MDKILTSNSNESSASDTNDDNNVTKLSPFAKQQQQMANQQIGCSRRFFCDDVLLDVLHFLQRHEHAQVRLASQRLQWPSNTACARYPPRELPRLEVRGVYDALPAADDVEAASQQKIVANSMRIHPSSGWPYQVDFPSVEPPEDIVHLSELEIRDFVGPELLQFLEVLARLMNGGCHLVFHDFDNFVRHHSADFIARFLALFPSTNRIVLDRLSSLANPLFRDHPAMFDCAHLIVECSDTFPLDALQNWLHLDEGKPLEQQQQKGRKLVILFEDHTGLPAPMGRFAQQLRQHFLGATSCCPFTVEFALFVLHVPEIPELDPFVEDNDRTGEQLEFSHDHRIFFKIERRRREITAGQEEGDREAEQEEVEETEERAAMQKVKTTKVHIRGVKQGDKQPVESEEEADEEAEEESDEEAEESNEEAKEESDEEAEESRD